MCVQVVLVDQRYGVMVISHAPARQVADGAPSTRTLPSLPPLTFADTESDV
jgi:hypothetical protein